MQGFREQHVGGFRTGLELIASEDLGIRRNLLLIYSRARSICPKVETTQRYQTYSTI